MEVREARSASASVFVSVELRMWFEIDVGGVSVSPSLWEVDCIDCWTDESEDSLSREDE